MNFRREIAKKCIAQMCLNLGWEGITSSALDTLTNVLENYFFTVAHVTHLTSEWKDDPELSFQDLFMSLDKLDINLADLSDYISLADHTPLPISIPYFPASRHKIATKTDHKASSGKDIQASQDKKQGNECLTPIKNSKVIPKEAEASQYEMKSFSLVNLENGDLFPEIKGHAPNSKIHKPQPVEDPTYKNSKTKSLTLNTNKSFLEATKEKVETKRPKQICDYTADVGDKSYSKTESPNMPFSSMKKHRKPTTKEVLIAKKKQSQSTKLATRMVKVDSFDANSEHKKKKPGRKPKKIPKSRPLVTENEEIDVITAMTPIETDKGDYLMEVVNTVVEENLIGEQNDTMLEDDLELGAVNDEMLVEIADRGGDSPLSHLTGIPIQNRELFHNTDIFGTSCPIKDNADPQVNIDVEEEILPWSDDEKPKDDHLIAHKATGLELILRGQGDGSSNGSILYMSPEKNDLSHYDKDKKRLKKLKKLKKNQKHDKYPKPKKIRPDILNDSIRLPTDERSYLDLQTTPDDQNNKYSFNNMVKTEETFESYQTATKFSENSDFNDSELDVINLKKEPQVISSIEPLKSAQENISEPEISHKKKKKKGKRKQEGMDEISTPKSKKIKRESFEAPIIPKLTLKFGGATVCGGVTSSPNLNREIENSGRHSLPAPIKLVIKPNIHGHQQKRHSISPEPVHYSPAFSPSYHHRSVSPDQLSIPSVALSSRSPSPNDIARLASGPSNRKNLSSIYSESPSPPREGHSASNVFHPRKHLHPHMKQKNKEPKHLPPPPPPPIPPVKSSPFNKSNVNKSLKSAIVSETVGMITKENGEVIWICPTCGCTDSGTPMIACDGCDNWHHWTCVNITKEPPAEMNWYCLKCKKEKAKNSTPNKRGRPAGKGKSKK